MDNILAISTALNLTYFAIAVLAHFAALRLLDRMAGIDFKAMIERMDDNSMALAIYFAARFLGVALLASAFIK